MAQIQVEETNKEGLKREFTVKVPKQEIEKTLTARLQQFGRTAKLPGFRPGKVPLDVLQQRFGPSLRGEVLDKMVSKASQKALNDRKLRPAGEPQIELVNFAEGQDLEFKLAVEIMPEIKTADMGKIAVERPVTEVTEKAVDEAIERLAKSVREPETVAEKRAAKKGDTLVIDFEGSVDGKSEEGMKGADHRLELGSQSFIDTFEDQLVGSKAGDKKKIKVMFPAEYHAPHLSGKQAEFAVEVKELRAHKPVEMNDELAKEIGLDSLATLRERVKESLATDHNRVSRAVVRRRLMDKLADAHDFKVPPGLVAEEFANIWKQVEESKKRGTLPKDEAKKTDVQLKKDYEEIAERRIRLGLLLSDIGQKANISVTQKELQEAMMAEARRFPGQEKAVIEYYAKTPGAAERLRAPLLEEKIVDHILAQVKVTEKKMPAEELLKLPQEMD